MSSSPRTPGLPGAVGAAGFDPPRRESRVQLRGQLRPAYQRDRADGPAGAVRLPALAALGAPGHRQGGLLRHVHGQHLQGRAAGAAVPPPRRLRGLRVAPDGGAPRQPAHRPPHALLLQRRRRPAPGLPRGGATRAARRGLRRPLPGLPRQPPRPAHRAAGIKRRALP
ncbi:hypothetical protein ONE63_000188 [Megalurothrips usitatus]|uniref:Uncharacterized protein n=1 Tax=Megalurothrips usitatus TaxID=439358 RepID=A0AAV7Y0P7_9NEOP|nr:hypothetical protein ONE63_000188 [Megalurothrips usitatus]